MDSSGSQLRFSTDYDDDSNERDRSHSRYFKTDLTSAKTTLRQIRTSATNSTFTLSANNLPAGFEGNIRMQIHSAQPITDNFTLVPQESLQRNQLQHTSG